MKNIVRILLYCKNTKFDQKTVSLLCVKTKSGAHKQLTFYFQMRKYFCRHLHSSLISMARPRHPKVEGSSLATDEMSLEKNDIKV